MGERFERSHDVVIQVTPAEVLDYVSNPNSWREWMPATHDMDAPDRPLQAGETFVEKWATRQGEVQLDWSVAERRDGELWVATTTTPFTGPIEARYVVSPEGGGCRYTRMIVNPDRPKMPTAEMVERMDAEAEVCLSNIKRILEAR